MGEDKVIYNGVPMDPMWPAMIENAQTETTYVINGSIYERIRYGDEADDWKPLTREQVVSQMAVYAERQLAAGTRIHHISRHMLGLFAGRPGARGWRRFISEAATNNSAGPEVLLESIAR